MQISYHKNGTGGTIRWDQEDWLAGLGVNAANITSSPYPEQISKGLMWMERINPFRLLKNMSSGPLAVNVTNASTISTGFLRAAVNNGSTGYMIGGTDVHRIDLTNNTVSTGGSPFPHAIGSAVIGYDVVMYNIGTTPYLFYSYTTASNGNVGRYDLSSTFIDAWASVTPTGAGALSTTNPHHLIVSPRTDVMYITDGRALHAFDGQVTATGTLTLNRFLIPADYVITSFSLTNEFLVIYAYKNTSGGSLYAGECTAFFWDEVSEDPTYAIKINGSYVDGGFTYNGVPGCFVRSSDMSLTPGARNNHLMLQNGTEFQPMFSFGNNEDLPSKNGVQVTGNSIFWNSSGTIWQYGSPILGLERAGIRYSLGGGTSLGFLKSLVTNVLYGSTGTSTSGGLQLFSSSSLGAGSFLTFLATPDLPDGKIARVKHVRVGWGAYKTSGQSALIQTISTLENTTTTTSIKPSATLPRRSIDRYIPRDYVAPRFQSIGFNTAYNDGTEYIKFMEIDFNYENYA